MKSFLFVISLLLASSFITNAQDTLWVNKMGTIVSVKDSASSFIINYKDPQDTQRVKSVYHDMKGAVTGEYSYYPYSPKRVLNGTAKRYTDGRLTEEKNYVDDQLNGVLTTFWESGVVKRKDVYEKGKMLKGQCFSSTGADTTWFEYEKAASFPGGVDSMRKFIVRKFEYPVEARRLGLQGTAKVQFIVNKEGAIEEPTVINKVDPILAKAAIELVKKMPKWSPAIMDGNIVKMYFVLPIVFRMAD